MITKPQLPPKKGYVEIEVNNKRTYRNIETGLTIEQEQELTYKTDEQLFQEAQSAKLSELSTACNKAITAGVDAETTEGTEHFSLEETDQINLTAALSAVEQGTEQYPYHADKKLCRMFTAEEIKNIAKAATEHKLYHTTLCNHLLIWARRVTTIEELKQITYSAENLPTDLAENMTKIIGT